MKKINKLFVLMCVFAALLCVGALAASAEPAAASAEPAAEETAVVNTSFDVNFSVNGQVVKTATVDVEVEDNEYRFQIGSLLDILGIELEYDEATGIATIRAKADSPLAGVMGASEEPAEEAVEEEPVEQATDAAAEGDVPATDGTENQSNVLAGTAAPATAEEFNAYVAYCQDYMENYDGVGDGTFDDSARDMALGELSSVSFGADVNAFPFEMFVSVFGAKDYAAFLAG